MTNNITEGSTHSELATGWSGRGSLGNLIAELDRQKESKFDFVGDTRQMMLEVEERENAAAALRLIPKAGAAQLREFMPGDGLPIRDIALEQIGGKSSPGVPWKFLRNLRDEKPFTAANLLNDMMADENRRFVRCLDGSVRAFLSDRYRVLDNYDIAFTALDAVRDLGGEVIEASLSDRYMRLKFTTRSIFDAIDENRQGPKSNWYAGGMGSQDYLGKVGASSQGDLPGGPGTVHPLVTITNSETGHGGFRVRIGIMRAICFNLATVEDVAANVHLGGAMDLGLFTEETVTADSRAIYLKARDAVAAAFTEERFRALVARCNKAQATEVKAPTAAVANVAKAAGIGDGVRDSILEHFLRDYDSTAYGLSQAIARQAQDIDDADAAFDLEEAAGQLIRTPAMAAVEE